MTQDPRPDPVLRRMLDHAPDREAQPHPATREAIRRGAYNAVAAPPLAVRPVDGIRAPWWRRLWRQPAVGERMPWNAAFATVLVAVFVTVLWHREPVPDARPDTEFPVSSSAPADAPPPAPHAAESAAPPVVAQVPGAAQTKARPAPAPAERPALVPPSSAAPASGPAPLVIPRGMERAADEKASAKARDPQSPSRLPAPAEALPSPAPAAPVAPPAAEVADADSSSAVAVDATGRSAPAPAAAARERRAATERQMAAASSKSRREDLPTDASAPVTAGAASPRTVERSESMVSPARQPHKDIAAAPPAAGAWHGWTHLRIADATGGSRRLTRAEAGPLAALVGAVIPAAGGTGNGAGEGGADPGWRLTLEGRDGVLGVLDVPLAPGGTLRWREGAHGTTVRFAPPPPLLQALQSALQQ